MSTAREDSDSMSREAAHSAMYGDIDPHADEVRAAMADTNPLDRRLVVTMFADKSGVKYRHEYLTFRELAIRIRNTDAPSKGALPLLKLASFGGKRTPKGSARFDDNVLTVSGIEADYDDEKLSIDEAVALLRNAHVAGMVYSSPSHSEDAPRWRILCPLSCDYRPADRAWFTARLNGIVHGVLARESFTLSQSYYLGKVGGNPSHQVVLVDGDCIDLRDDLDDDAIGLPVKAPPSERPVASGPFEPTNTERFAAVSEERRQGLLNSLLDNLRQNAVDGNKHHALRGVARMLGGYAAEMGIGDEEAVQMLLDCLPDSVEDWQAARTTALWGLARGREQPVPIENRPLERTNCFAANIDMANLTVRGQRVYEDVPPQADEAPRPDEPADAEQAPNGGEDDDARTYLANDEADEHIEADEAEAADEPDRDEAEPGRGMGLTGQGARAAINKKIDELNERYMVVSEAGKTVIYRPEFDPVLKRRNYVRMTFGDFKNLLMSKYIRVGTDAEGRGTYKCIADVWLRSPRRLEYPNGIVFDPTGAKAEGKLNLWRGFSVVERPGDWSLMQDHVRTIVCDGNIGYYDWLLDWCASLFQNPAEAGQVAVVMKGGQGTGKGLLARVLIYLISHHALAIAHTKHLVGNFNSHLRDIVLLFADEAFLAGDKSHIGVLNSLITEPYLAIEGKGQNLVTVPNYLHVVMASNEDWVVPASLDARRFFVLLVSAARAGDLAYFQAIMDQMEAGGYEAMLYDLLHRDISRFRVRSVPVTQGLQEQRKLSLKVEEAWWLDCLLRGYVFKSKLGLEEHFATWHEEVSTELLFASYVEFANQHRDRRQLSREAFGKFMIRMNGKDSAFRLVDVAVGEHIVDVEVPVGNRVTTVRKAQIHTKSRPPGYYVKTLDEARTAFVAVTGLPVDWDKDDMRVRGVSGH